MPPAAAAPAGGPIIESFIARATAETPRHSEGDLLVLRDGTLLAAWSEFYGGARDDAPARIAAVRSNDAGRTWSDRFVLQENAGRANVMSVSFLRSRTGDALFFYLVKNSASDLKVHVRRSRDDARSWEPAVIVTPADGYHVMNNARVIQLRSGRLLAPVAVTQQVGTKDDRFRTRVFRSDDDGRTWQSSRNSVGAPKRGAMEPGVVQLRDGRVLQIIRTQTGLIWRSFSKDEGETWSEAEPWNIESPESPATLVALPSGGDWLLVWNPSVVWGDPARTVLGANHGGLRTPLAAMISRDEGATWSPRREVESERSATYAYTSVTFHDGRVLMTYYHFPVGGKQLSLKFKSVPYDWFGEVP